MNKSDDTISRQDAIRWVKTECNPYGKPTLDFESGKRVIEHLEQMPSEDRPTTDCTEFIKWLTEAVLDEEDWRMNPDAYGEVICRKLKKLGLLDVEDGYYVDTRPTGEWVDADGNKVRLDADGHPLGSCWCNNCGEWLVASDEHEVLGKFCPNCGARMEVNDE